MKTLTQHMNEELEGSLIHESNTPTKHIQDVQKQLQSLANLATRALKMYPDVVNDIDAAGWSVRSSSINIGLNNDNNELSISLWLAFPEGITADNESIQLGAELVKKLIKKHKLYSRSHSSNYGDNLILILR